jgi:plastocyanin
MKLIPNLKQLLTLTAILAVFFACSKSSGYSNGNGNTTSTSSAVSIANFAFSAATLKIAAGTTVKWTNNDAVPHTVTADDGSFDSGTMAPGSTYSKTFTTPGTYAYHCSVHPSMKASVDVQ